jgi:hypothetical protein
METLIALGAVGLIIACVVYLVATKKHNLAVSSRNDHAEATTTRDNDKFAAHMDMLTEKWKMANDEQESGNLKITPHWFFDDATERQRNKLRDLGVTFHEGKYTKGQVSDIIGLFYDADEEEKKILRFFKVPLRNFNQTKARFEVAKIFSDPEKLEAWNSRPATDIQKEFFRFFDKKVPKGLTHETAKKMISQISRDIPDNRYDDWTAFESVYEELLDPEIRNDYGVKKISMYLYREAMNSFVDEGRKLADLEGDVDEVVERVIKLKPEIQK